MAVAVNRCGRNAWACRGMEEEWRVGGNWNRHSVAAERYVAHDGADGQGIDLKTDSPDRGAEPFEGLIRREVRIRQLESLTHGKRHIPGSQRPLSYFAFKGSNQRPVKRPGLCCKAIESLMEPRFVKFLKLEDQVDIVSIAESAGA